jgi:hypothetical protein
MPDHNGPSVLSPLVPTPACSDWARSQSLSPIGSAGYYNGFLLVEQPLPWPGDVSEIPELAEVSKVAYAARLRLQAVVRAGTLGSGRDGRDGQGEVAAQAADAVGSDDARTRRLICYRSTRPGWAGPMARSERASEPGSLLEAALALVEGGEVTVEGGAGTPGAELPGEVVDLLVCTHGRRDACCGARGTELLGELSAVAALGELPNVRLWRTSHTGGHRFAPTAVTLPSATLWAFADAELLARVVKAEGPLSTVVPRYRGCASIGSEGQQAVEKAVLSEVGWALLGSWRRAVDLGDGIVRLETELAGTWEALAREGRRVAAPECRTDPALARKQSVEWVVEGLRQVVPA